MWSRSPSARLRASVVLLACVALTPALAGATATAQADTPPGAIGVQDQVFAPTMVGSPTGTKPESKLWFAHGSWWAVMWQPAGAGGHRIWRLNRDTGSWEDTGTPVDARSMSRADALSEADGSLTVASHYFVNAGHNSTTPAPAPGTGARLYRYAWDGAGYVAQDGSPVEINPYKSETLVIDRDATGVLWATWTYGEQAYVAHTTLTDATWTAPQVVPDTGPLDSDDISSLVAFSGHIGVMVSNQLDGLVHFAVHDDGDSDLLWNTEVVPTGWSSDDHINLKADSAGRVFAALKTSESTATNALVLLAVRSAAGAWTATTFGTVRDRHTRAIVVLDEEHDLVHMLAADSQTGGNIVEKTASMADAGFDPGQGAVVLHNPGSPNLNDATSTKQSLDADTGMVVLADDDKQDAYWHLDEPLGPVSLAIRFTVTPATGDAPLTVRFADKSLGDPTSWTWDFGDSVASTQRSPTHVYTEPGTYTAWLTISNGQASATSFRVVTVTRPAPPTSTPPTTDGPGTQPPTPGTPVTRPDPTVPQDAPSPDPPATQAPSGDTHQALSPGTHTPPATRPGVARLAGTIVLRGRSLTTTIRCSASGQASLSHLGGRLAAIHYRCRAGRAVLRFTVGPRTSHRLRRVDSPRVAITVTTATGRTTLRHRLQWSSD